MKANQKWFLTGVLTGAAIMFLIFGRYRYDHLGGGLIRIDRITQKVSSLTSDGWKNYTPNSPADVKY
jgi:hypothetical protein